MTLNRWLYYKKTSVGRHSSLSMLKLQFAAGGRGKRSRLFQLSFVLRLRYRPRGICPGVTYPAIRFKIRCKSL